MKGKVCACASERKKGSLATRHVQKSSRAGAQKGVEDIHAMPREVKMAREVDRIGGTTATSGEAAEVRSPASKTTQPFP